MKAVQILKVTPKTQNLIAMNFELSILDLLIAIRYGAQKYCYLGYLCINSRGNPETILAKDPNNVSFDKFKYLVSGKEKKAGHATFPTR